MALASDFLRAGPPAVRAEGRAVGRAPAHDEPNDVALVLNERGRIVRASPSARSILGARSADLLGLRIGQLAVPEDRLSLGGWLTQQRVPDSGPGHDGGAPIAFRVARRYGRTAHALARSVHVDGDPDSWQVLVELRVSAEPRSDDGSLQLVALQERLDHLDRSNRQLENLACTAAHDLRTPLASLAASVELLVRHAGPVLDETSQELVSDVLRGVGHMSQLVDGLLRCSLAGVRLQIEVSDGDTLVGEVVHELQVEFDAAEAVVTVAPIGPVVADVEQLRSVFRNLLANAARYRSVERPLRVWIDVHKGSLEHTFTVSDNGTGIPVADRDRVFTMFERVDPRTPGSGIGLATCQRVVEGHGGRIWLDDGIDGGTAVHFTLPAQHLLSS